MTGTRDDVFKALSAIHGEGNVLKGKDSGFFVRGRGVVSLAVARKETGISAPERSFRPRMLPWGDYATIAMLNRGR